MKELQSDTSIVILPADKGRSTVILNREDYLEKCMAHINNGPYQLLKKDPTTKIKTKTLKQLKVLKDNEFIGNKLYYCLKPADSLAPRFYGQTEIHKPGVPTRPIASYSGSPLYNLNKYIGNILKAHVKDENNNAKNSTTFSNYIRNVPIEDDEIMESSDLTSLYTNIPIIDTLNIIKDYVNNDDQFTRKTAIPQDKFLDLVHLVLTTTWYTFNSQFYQQTDGVAMVGLASSTTAEIYMQAYERTAITTTLYPPKVWERFVDGVYSILQCTHLENFFHHINNLHQNIKFTMEEESNGELAFLDTLLKRNNGEISVLVYSKPTHTDQYLHYSSQPQTSCKENVASSLFNRTYSIITNKDDLHKENARIKQVLKENGYRESIINKIFRRITNNHSLLQSQQLTQATDIQEEEIRVSINLPYVEGTSEKLRRILRSHKIRSTLYTEMALCKLFCKSKDQVATEDKNNIVYEIDCSNCQAVYFGESKRSLKSRSDEHKRSVRNCDFDKNQIAKHFWEADLSFNWDQKKVIDMESRLIPRKITETIHSLKNSNHIDKIFYMLPEIWLPNFR